VASRVSTITQQVLSRTSLVKVIDEFGLYQGMIKEDGYESAILNMRKNIQVETKGRSRIEAFTISFAHNDPTTAMKVTSKLASKYIQENLKLREQFVEGASDFLETELRASRNELETKEYALGQFKKKYMGELPSQLEGNISTLDRLQAERVSNQESINTITNRLMLVDQAIHEYETSGSVSANAEINVSGGGRPGRPSIDPQMAQLRTLEQDLVRLSAEYTDVYPDVILLKQQIGVLKAELRARTDMSVEETDSPETIQIFDPYLKRLVKDRGELNFQIATLNKRMNTIGTSMDMLQGRVDRTAAQEQALLSLNRDYANMQENYQDLLSKRLNARIAENLEKRQKGERFRILDPANLPNKPQGPQRMLIVLAGLAVGLALGYGLAFLIEQWNPTFRRSKEAEVSLGFPILATIPSFQMAYGKSSDGLLIGGSFGSMVDGSSDNESANGDLIAKPSDGGKWRAGAIPDASLVSRWRPNSIVAEQYRVAATRLVLLNDDRANTVVLATSAMKGEGKTSSVVNLGYTLARDLEKQVLLIGCDFKAPRLHKAMGMPAAPGLADYFHGNVGLENCIHRMDDVPLWVLPAGAVEEHAVSLSRLP